MRKHPNDCAKSSRTCLPPNSPDNGMTRNNFVNNHTEKTVTSTLLAINNVSSDIVHLTWT